jgi:hypothetical protein
MLASDALTISGLVLNLMGVFLLFRYGMPYRVEVKGYSLLLEQDPTDEDVRLNRKYGQLGRLGLLFIVLGTVLQAVATFFD